MFGVGSDSTVVYVYGGRLDGLLLFQTPANGRFVEPDVGACYVSSDRADLTGSFFAVSPQGANVLDV